MEQFGALLMHWLPAWAGPNAMGLFHPFIDHVPMAWRPLAMAWPAASMLHRFAPEGQGYYMVAEPT
jgi:hypothetical protein